VTAQPAGRFNRSGRRSRRSTIAGLDSQDNYTLARIENFVRDQLGRRLNYFDLANVQGIWTARRLEMSDVRKGSRTVLTLDKLEYNVPLKDENFTLQALRRQ
jgi:hypothetical protein